MLSFILAFILLALFFAGLILFPYKKVAQWLKRYIHLPSFISGILLIIYSLIFEGKQAPVPPTNEIGEFLTNYTSGLQPFLIVSGGICIVASFFIRRYFSNIE